MNTEDFIKRLEHVLEYYGLTASSFADKINVQRSSISHLLSGRNKPSLDFILKVLEQFPEIDLLWFLNGVGVFPNTSKSQSSNSTEIKAENKNIPEQINLFDENRIEEENRVVENKFQKKSNTPILEQVSPTSEIEKIIVFYKDGTFKSYTEK
ncbi:helix-turn-helix transcriptional regulator [Flavobacterium sp. 20NA77.7]|uniref:Helix-turn-helix transcriptional regulator n=2 Tax=Flavobacterium nakdongensis TaxID=3073563 RepID=A0ABY9RBV6_9FLAO|nr:helix-turn-helix transcriptional regulator [Flavobacterium sp. 20NA77.7]WMW78728.1 helix-turn-helix transcriptional regulator [Flavobacterium sp. 20NA77.7]